MRAGGLERPRGAGRPAAGALESRPRGGYMARMGLHEHRQALRQAELRVDQVKASL